jgi:hypothetical protein
MREPDRRGRPPTPQPTTTARTLIPDPSPEREKGARVRLRCNIHNLLDAGYVTITPRPPLGGSAGGSKKGTRTGHGRKIALPDDQRSRQDRAALEWHNGSRFRA